MDPAIQYQLDHPNDSRQPGTIAAMTVITVAASIAVVLRLAARRKTRIQLNESDYLIFASLLVGYANFAVNMASKLLHVLVHGGGLINELDIHLGMGRHQVFLAQSRFASFFKIFLVIEVFYCTSVFLTKTSVLFFYRRIFGTTNNKFVIALYCIGIFNLIIYVVGVLVFIFQCSPVEFNWNKAVKGKCISIVPLMLATALPILTTDILVVGLSVPMVWKLTLSGKQKRAVIGIFCLGFFVCIASIIRIPMIFNVDYTDIAYSEINPAVWSLVEVMLGIVGACLPLLRPLFIKNNNTNKISYGPTNSYNLDRMKGSYRRQSDFVKSSESEEKIFPSQSHEGEKRPVYEARAVGTAV